MAITEYKNETLKATYNIIQHILKFVTYGGDIIADQIVDYNLFPIKPPNPTKVGYSFDNWYTDNTFTDIFNFNTLLTTDTEIHAKFIINTYIVKFDSRGGSYVPPQSITYGNKATKPADPTYTGHTFSGWFYDINATMPFDFDNDAITDNTTLYPLWIIDGHTVTFNSQGGTDVPSQVVSYGSYAYRPISPTKVGNTFDGWYTEPTLENHFNFESTAIYVDMTLYASWLLNKYTISFDVDGGSTVEPIIEYYGNYISEPTSIKYGFNDAGWYFDNTFISKVDFNVYTVDKDRTMYKKWIPYVYSKLEGPITVEVKSSGDEVTVGQLAIQQMIQHLENDLNIMGLTVDDFPVEAYVGMLWHNVFNETKEYRIDLVSWQYDENNPLVNGTLVYNVFKGE